MATNAVEFVLGMRDKVSGPAKAAAKSLAVVEKSVKDVDAASKAAERTQARLARTGEAQAKAQRDRITGSTFVSKVRTPSAARYDGIPLAPQIREQQAALERQQQAAGAFAGPLRPAALQRRPDASAYVMADGQKKLARASGLSTKQLYAFGAESRRAGSVASYLGDRIGGVTATSFVKAHGAMLRGATAVKTFAGNLPSLGSMASSATSSIASMGPALMSVGVALLAVGAGAVGLVAAGAKYATEMAGFKEQTLFAYKYVLGSSEKADLIFREADSMARAMGGKTSLIGESMRELMSGGFSDSDAKTLTMAMQDVVALNPSANIGQISTQIAQMKGAGRVLQQDLKPMLDAGLNDDIFYKQLRSITGIDDQVKLKKAMEAGKVSADQGIQAIVATIAEMGGNKGLGSVAAARANETMGGQIDSTKAMFERLFMSIEGGPTGAAIGRLAAQMQSFLDPKGASGQRLLAIFGAIATAVGTVFASLQGGTLDGILGGMLSFFETVRPVAAAFFGAFAGGFGEAFATVKTIFAAFSSGAGPTLDMVGIAKALGAAFAWVAVGIASVVAIMVGLVAAVGLVVVGIGTAIVDIVGALAEFAANFGAKALEIGTMFVRGLVDGITGGAVSVVDAVTNLGSSAIEAIQTKLQIHSPSRVFAEVGGYMAEGLTQGVEGGAPMVSAAVGNLVSPSSFAGAGRATSSSSGGRMEVNITINGADLSDPKGIATEIRSALEDFMRDHYQGMAIELGVSPAGV